MVVRHLHRPHLELAYHSAPFRAAKVDSKVPLKLKRPEVPLPKQMKHLPLTEGGYLKPCFVQGDDFRITDSDKAGL